MLLRGGSRHWSIFSRRADKGRRSSERLAGLDRLFEMVRHLGDGRGVKKSGGLKLDFRNVVNVSENMCGKKRVAARRKEVIVNTDLLKLKDLGPTLGQQFLERRSWRDEGTRWSNTGRKTQLGGQADTLHFA